MSTWYVRRRLCTSGRHLGSRRTCDTAAIQMKLDELIRAAENADNHLVGIKERSAEELELIRRDKAPVQSSD
ncbi:low affinity iron permease family protein [Methylobacterium sp. J-030]|uniref:low affinity iron permease family protein n=1 Tax=Methylobacterium sp. J-030 TaxID=2836627 RepID=UPI0024444D51|nr:low affinity iron permease family protein [Methylobacterium sp. J-030]